jgi:hypothetical protein
MGMNIVQFANTRSASEWAAQISAAWQKSTGAIIETGRLLIEAKASLDHGAWLPMVKTELPFSRQTAEKLMAVADHAILSNSAHVRSLPSSWGTLYELTKLPEPDLQAHLADGVINPKMQRKDVAALRGIAPRPRARREPSLRPPAIEQKSDIESAVQAFGPFDACMLRLRRLVHEVMNLMPAEQWPQLIETLRGELDDLAKRRP